MHTLTLPEIARALPNGRITAGGVSFTPPGHSNRDRSGRVLLNPARPFGIWVQSLAGDDELGLRDFVLDCVGIAPDAWRQERPNDEHETNRRRLVQARHERDARQKVEQRRRRAREMWEAAQHPAGSIVEAYLSSRALILGEDVSGSAIRFHPACPWSEDDGPTVFVPAMIAAMRDITSGEIVAVHRTHLSETGQKLGRKMYGTAGGAAIMLDGLEEITSGLAIGEGIESVMAARQMGIRPAWALGSIGAIASFPLIGGVETLTVLAENDPNGASDRGCREVAARWCAAGRTVDLVRPEHGKDLNDELMMGGVTA